MNKQPRSVYTVFEGGSYEQYKRVITTFTVMMALFFSAYMVTGTALAQDNLSNKISADQQYREELDRWMLQAYEGDRDAQFKVGVLFTNNQFNSADFEQAVYWYKQAARQGHALSQYNLGHQYLTGSGVKRSETEAMKWWLKAAEQDHPLAQFNVGRGYYLGIGLDENQTQSEYWFTRAAKNNEPKSIEILEQLGWAKPGEYAIANNTTEQTPEIEKVAEPIKESSFDATEVDATEVDATEEVVNADEDTSVNPSVIDTPIEPINTNNQSADTQGKPIAVYTNPNKRAVLISILSDRNDLTILKQSTDWARVQSKSGLPVWVHQDFIKVNGSQGTIKGDRINARSVPLISAGTIVGQLNDGTKVKVLDQMKQWYRVNSPATFLAWVKVKDLEQTTPSNSDVSNTTPAKVQNKTNVVYDNENDWLFDQEASAFTLQLASFDEPQTSAAFEAREKFQNNPDLHRFTAKSKDIEWTYYLYGSYNDAESAKASREKIGQKLAWVRSFDKLQQNRCLAWKKQIPTPKMLNKYCS